MTKLFMHSTRGHSVQCCRKRDAPGMKKKISPPSPIIDPILLDTERAGLGIIKDDTEIIPPPTAFEWNGVSPSSFSNFERSEGNGGVGIFFFFFFLGCAMAHKKGGGGGRVTYGCRTSNGIWSEEEKIFFSILSSSKGLI